MKTNLAEKLNPARFSEMSPLMAAIVGFILDESFTKPTIAELAVSELEDLVYIRPQGAVGFEGIQSLASLVGIRLEGTDQPSLGLRLR